MILFSFPGQLFLLIWVKIWLEALYLENWAYFLTFLFGGQIFPHVHCFRPRFHLHLPGFHSTLGQSPGSIFHRLFRGAPATASLGEALVTAALHCRRSLISAFSPSIQSVQCHSSSCSPRLPRPPSSSQKPSVPSLCFYIM